jgi:intracellular multiplication protein IcmV
MGVLKAAKKLTGWVFNFKVSQWVDYEYLKTTTRYYVRSFQSLFHSPMRPERYENFEEALMNLDIHPEELPLEIKRNQFIAYFFCLVSASFMVYCLYLIYDESWMGSWMTFALALYALTFAFRYHLWYYQLKRQNLNLSFRQWALSFVGRDVSKDIIR